MDVTVPHPQDCYDCGKTFTRDFNKAGFSHRLCPDCLKKSNDRAATRDCRFCNGKQTVHATYQMESEWGNPYICWSCMKDQDDGYVWPHIPQNVCALDVPMSEEALGVRQVVTYFNEQCQDEPEK